MTISSIHTACYRIPLPVPLSDSTHGEMPDFQLVTARLYDDAGFEGLGYTYTVGRGGKAVEALLQHDLAPLLIGRDPRPIEALWDEMQHAVGWVGRGGAASFAIAALDIALWDLAGRRAGQPLWRLLGGTDPRVRCYSGGIDLHFPLEKLLDQTRERLSEGYKAIKMKAGRPNLAEDVERVGAMRKLLGDDFPLMADANMGWTVDQAIEAAKALAPFNLVWLEEPIAPDDFAGHQTVAAKGGASIAAGENLHTVREFQMLIDQGGVRYPEPDAATLGGITPWLEVAKMADAKGRKVTSHGVHDLHVHLLAAVPNASYLEMHGFGLDRFQAETLEHGAGMAVAPDRPGHGVELDWDKLEPYRE